MLWGLLVAARRSKAGSDDGAHYGRHVDPLGGVVAQTVWLHQGASCARLFPYDALSTTKDSASSLETILICARPLTCLAFLIHKIVAWSTCSFLE